MKIKAIFFDLDGTLLDTAPDFIVCVNQLRLNHHLPPLADAAIRAQVSNGARALTQLAFALPETDPALEGYRQELLALYSQILGDHSTLFPGMAESLRWIEAQGLSWGIITNKPSAFTLPLLARLNLPFTPQAVICPDHVSRSKPDPEPMLLACTQCECSPEEALYLGDHIRDIQAGRAAGMMTVSCEWGYIGDDDDIASWQADHRISHANAIPDLVEFIIEKQIVGIDI